ncbi:MotA/TolQ/ExbB proton channel family protein [Roseibacterium sp. SDUM158016]|uniref:MotA/TolQ/ExbB proton channel family protein n=1 Tax=Roseicyclus sediminis TaxID=2980997 RepID=UPI0021CFAC2F|nr:MotA/TolQ/ExbB proton channel family protein [Roseibacterium sp. SDUM158016]MCU4651384.1 MotA/TolQ/ExbB proton channel family protein [Roseibacterium sp. SDUM158016]
MSSFSGNAMQDRLLALLDLGGPVVALLLLLSILALSAILYKIWQFRAEGVGRHAEIARAIAAHDAGDAKGAARHLAVSRSHLAPLLAAAIGAGPDAKPRIAAEAESRLARIERGFRLLDSIAQIAPLLGLFGTVLGMIDAFRALQDAGASVDPSALAGGIWVALLTTAGGLAIAMPTSLALTWFESRAEADRVQADLAIEALTGPRARAPERTDAT